MSFDCEWEVLTSYTWLRAVYIEQRNDMSHRTERSKTVLFSLHRNLIGICWVAISSCWCFFTKIYQTLFMTWQWSPFESFDDSYKLANCFLSVQLNKYLSQFSKQGVNFLVTRKTKRWSLCIKVFLFGAWLSVFFWVLSYELSHVAFQKQNLDWHSIVARF